MEISNNNVYGNGPNLQIFPDFIMGTVINTYGNTNAKISKNLSHNNMGGGILVEDSYNVLVVQNDVFENDVDATGDEWWDGGLWVERLAR